MDRLSTFLRLLLPVVVLVGPIGSAAAQDRSALPSRQHTSLRPSATLPIQRLDAVNTAALRQQARAETDKTGPYEYAKIIDTAFSPARHGTWEQLPSGQHLWRLRLTSADAVSLGLKFEPFSLPSGARLFLHNPDRPDAVRGPYSAADATKGQLWTPEVGGESVVVELLVPQGQRRAVDLRLAGVSHAFRSLFPSQSSGPQSKSLSCNIDVACPRATPWSDQTRSVGLYTLTTDRFRSVCSGALVNNTGGAPIPYFLTAEHCVQGSEAAAAAMTFYWNYQHPTCRPPGDDESGTVTSVDQMDQTSTGALLRMNYGNCKEENNRGGCPVDIMSGKPDLTLVEVDDPDLARYDLYLSGWNRQSPAPTDSAVAIHHPQGDAKRITFEYDPATITYLTRSSSRDDTHITVEWDAGTTEGGSSGGPLFTGSQRIVGVLSAGGRGCEIQDWFGRIALGFENGNYTPDGFQRPATLADWLDPTDSGTQTLDGRNLAADSIPPARASNFRVAEVTPDSVTLRWEAPGNDRMTGTADRYLLRYQVNTPIRSRSDFEQSTPVSTVPSPKSAGTSQSATVGVSPDSSYYFALVAQDEVRNASPLAVTDRDVTPTPGLRVVTPPAPNPARSQSRVSFAVREEQPVRVTLYDPLGRRLRVLRDETVRPFRRQTVQVDLSSLSSGVYFLRIRGQRAARTTRIAVVK